MGGRDMERYFVDGKNDRIIREDLYTVRLEKSNGEVIAALEPKKLFPYTDPDHYITLLEEAKNEKAVIKDISELSEDSREAIEACFKEIYMIPNITKVYLRTAKAGALTLKVDTDRGGPITFRIRNSNSDIKMLSDVRMVIRDSDDNRYEIPDVTKLDKKSLRQLYPYI